VKTAANIAAGWQAPPTPEPGSDGHLILIEFGFTSEGPEDRDRFAMLSSHDGKWMDANALCGVRPGEVRVQRWQWLRYNGRFV
jgi:hypothetical protein